MIKSLSYFNIFFGIVYFVIIKGKGNYLDLITFIPPILFNWLTLFHLIKHNLRFDKWHLYVGYLNVFISIISTIVTIKIIFGVFSNTSIYLGASIYLFLAKQLFDISIIFQFIIAFKENKRILSLSI